MRFIRRCLRGSIVLTIWGLVEAKDRPERSGKVDEERMGVWARMESILKNAREKVDYQCLEKPHTYTPDGGSVRAQTCGGNGCGRASPSTSKVTRTESHPKITQAPLLKRKHGSTRWDEIHEAIQGQKRDASECPADYQLCPQSLKGGCCPNDRVCGLNSCILTAAATASACGYSGYIPCGIEDGGGCCPSDYACGRAGCTPPVGASMTETCGMNSYLCPASLNYGCCENGMACGLSNCYSTEVVTLTLTSTLTTTDSNSAQHTITTTMLTGLTPASPTVGATAGAGIISVVPKLYTTAASAIAKISATSTSTPSSGLSKSQIGGIIGGACILLFVILFATFLIMRRLNKAIALSKSQSSSSRSRRRPTRPLQNPEVDALSIDPFNMERELINSNVYMEPRTSRPVPLAALYNTTQDGIEAISPPAFSPNSPPFHTSRGYNAVPISESSCCSGSQSCSSCSGSHALSDTSSPPMNSRGNNPGGYFDQYSPPPRSHSHHGRDWSDGSSRSEASNHTIKELDAGRDGHWYRGPDRRSGIRKALEEFGMSKWGGGRRINRGDKETVGLIGQEAPIGTSAREGQTPRGEMDAVGLGIPAFISEMGSGSRPGTAGWAEKKKSKGEPAVARNERISALQTPDMGFSAEMVEVRTQERRGLSNKQLRDISRASRQGLPDYDAIRPKSKALSDDPEKD